MAKRLRHQRIRTTFSTTRMDHSDAEISGCLAGRDSYVWVGVSPTHFLGILRGQSLYRLAKAIVRHFEEDRDA